MPDHVVYYMMQVSSFNNLGWITASAILVNLSDWICQANLIKVFTANQTSSRKLRQSEGWAKPSDSKFQIEIRTHLLVWFQNVLIPAPKLSLSCQQVDWSGCFQSNATAELSRLRLRCCCSHLKLHWRHLFNIKLQHVAGYNLQTDFWPFYHITQTLQFKVGLLQV